MELFFRFNKRIVKIWDTLLRKLYEMTVNNEIETIDVYEIGKEIGLLDKTQTYNLVNELIYHGYKRKKNGSNIFI